MALPEDFNKIYGSTATGGLTPISDVNYAKGWEFVGSNPPTKNDFSYLQNLSDLKSQWLYLNKLQRTDPFGDIKSDGTVQAALENLGLGEAAKRDVGTGANQIPDMSSFPASDALYALPSGIVHQFFEITTVGTGDKSVNFPTAFANKCFVVLTQQRVPSGFNAESLAVTNKSNVGFNYNIAGDNAGTMTYSVLAIGR